MSPGRLEAEVEVARAKKKPLRTLGCGVGNSDSNSHNQYVQPKSAKPSQKARSGSTRRIAPAVARHKRPRKTVKAALPAKSDCETVAARPNATSVSTRKNPAMEKRKRDMGFARSAQIWTKGGRGP